MTAQPDDKTPWICTVCGYVYDPRLHAGQPFGALPEDWLCPGCGFGKNVFRPHPAGPTASQLPRHSGPLG